MPKSKYKRKSSGLKRKKPGARKSYAKSSNPRGKRM